MKLYKCPGLSRYDTITVFYYAMVVLTYLSVVLSLRFYKLSELKMKMWFFPVVSMIHDLIFYFLGIFSGIIISRSTVRENLESLGFVKTSAVSDLDNSITVI